MNRKNAYLFLCILGTVLPYSQFVPWLVENGLNAQFFVRQLFANRIGAFFGWDVLVSGVVLVGFVRSEGKRLGMNLIAGACLDLPLVSPFAQVTKGIGEFDLLSIGGGLAIALGGDGEWTGCGRRAR